jgi:hypothetical protein
MANLDTASKRTSSIGLLLVFLLTPPIPDGTLAAGDRQHIGLSYSGILASGAAAIAFVFDLNTRLRVYLETLYSQTPPRDLQTNVTRYLASASGDANSRFRQLIDDATP